MRLGIMQPYFFPYLGYFQLISTVDKFIFLNDVNYIKKGWINRNRILVNNSDFFLTVPLSKSSQNIKINQIEISKQGEWNKKILKTIFQNYKKAPFFDETYKLVEKVLAFNYTKVDELSKSTVLYTCEHLNIETTFGDSEGCYHNNFLKGKERILDICLQENAIKYINLPGGKELYNQSLFQSKGIDLQFICSGSIYYNQFSTHFLPNLSIIDVLMFMGKEGTKRILKDFTLE
jgi:hypothetical protein